MELPLLNDPHSIMDSTHDLSVGELLEQLLADSLIDACQISGESLTIVQGANRHSFPYDQARTFLTGMLRGRTWNLKPGVDAGASAAPAPEPSTSTALPDDEMLPPAPVLSNGPGLPHAWATMNDRALSQARAATNGPALSPAGFPTEDGILPPGSWEGGLSLTLDSLLSMAKEMELIVGWENEPREEFVTLALPACKSQLRRDEAVIFLSECILYRLKTISEEVHRLAEGSGESKIGRDRAMDAQTEHASRAEPQTGGEAPVGAQIGRAARAEVQVGRGTRTELQTGSLAGGETQTGTLAGGETQTGSLTGGEAQTSVAAEADDAPAGGDSGESTHPVQPIWKRLG